MDSPHQIDLTHVKDSLQEMIALMEVLDGKPGRDAIELPDGRMVLPVMALDYLRTKFTTAAYMVDEQRFACYGWPWSGGS